MSATDSREPIRDKSITSIAPLRLVAGLGVGLASGMLMPVPLSSRLLPVVEPIGKLWLDALTMTVVPLLFGLLTTGIAFACRRAAAGRTTGRAMLCFAVMLTASSLAGMCLSEGLLTVWPVDPGALPVGLPAAALGENATGTAWYEGIIPVNPVRAAADMSIVPLVVFSLFLGFALGRLPASRADTLLAPIEVLVDAMLVIVGWVLRLGPFGIAALAFGAGARMGSDALGTLTHYVLIVSAACLLATLLAYAWVLLGSHVPVMRFARAVLPAQAVALGTQSSLASLPIMVEASNALPISHSTAKVVLPLAVSLFRAASVAANVAVAVYLSHLHESPLPPGALILLALLAVPVSLAAVGLPAQVSFFATIAPLCLAFDIPVTTLPLLLAIEAIPDIFRTLGNVTSDLAVSSVVGSCERAGQV